MVIPGVGTFTLTPAPTNKFVVLGTVTPPVAYSLAVPAPAWMLSATGMRLPPITRSCPTPAHVVVLELAPSGFQLETPAVKERLVRPSSARAPNAVPFPTSVFGNPASPLMVTPVPPFGLFQIGIPCHCAAAGIVKTVPSSTMISDVRFIRILHRHKERVGPADPVPANQRLR